MLGIVTLVNIREECADEFASLLKETAEKSESLEPGCLSYQGFRQQRNRASFIVVEQYSDQAALEAHALTDHFKFAMERFASLVAGEPEIIFCDVI